jgi:hypothetical protein
MSRKSLGIIVVLLFVLGAVFYWSAPGEDAKNIGGQTLRVALVLAALWLAFPQIVALFSKLPRKILSWFVGGSKPPAGQQAGGEPREQAPRVKRPRRRSNS